MRKKRACGCKRNEEGVVHRQTTRRGDPQLGKFRHLMVEGTSLTSVADIREPVLAAVRRGEALGGQAAHKVTDRLTLYLQKHGARVDDA